MIEIDGISLIRGATEVLSDITLTIPTGGVTVIIGPNGAGKSTLLHCIAGLLSPTRGRVGVEKVDIPTASEAERAKLMSLLTQQTASAPRLSVHALVSFGRWPQHRGRPTAEDIEKTE